MRIIEILSEAGTIGTTGSTSGSPGTVSPVSNVPSDKPATTTSPVKTQTANTNLDKLAKLLMQQGKTKPEDLTQASTALQKTMQNPNNPNLDDEEKSLLGTLMGSTLKDPSTVTAIKAVAMQKPQTQIGQQPKI